MPTFFPPLGAHSQATWSSASSSFPFLQLNFLAELSPDECQSPPSGRYELWTDVDEIKDGCEGGHGVREWHAVPYHLVPASDADHEAHLQARILVHARPQTFGYTLRLVKDDGEVIWLGNGGDNGWVEVMEGGQCGEVKDNGLWKGYKDRVGDEDVMWTGIAVDMSAKVVTALPTSSPLRTQIIIARSERPRPFVPFCVASSGGEIDVERIKSEYIVIASNSPDIDIHNGVLPLASPDAYFGRDTNLSDTIAKLNIAFSEASRNHAKDLSEAIITRDQIPSLSISAPKTWLLVHDAPKSSTLTIPASPEPVLMQFGDRTHVHHLGNSPTLAVDKGLTATFLSVTPFAQLRGTGEGIIWLCTPQGKATEEGEEEVEDDLKPVVHLPASPAQEARRVNSPEGERDKIDDGHHDANHINVRNVANDDNDDDGENENAKHNDRDPNESSSSSGTAPESTNAHHSKTGLMAFLSRLLNRVFAWFFWPFGYGMSKPVSGDTNTSSTESTPETPAEPAEGVAQVDERTPLLSTPGLSRSTSESVFSALASPESFETIKPTKLPGAHACSDAGASKKNDQKGMNGYTTPNPYGSTSTSTSTLGLALSSPTFTPPSPPSLASPRHGTYNAHTSAPHATVRSYIRFSLDSLDDVKGATFWAYKDGREEGGGRIKTEELAFAARKMGEREWKGVDVRWEEEEQGPIRAVLGLDKWGQGERENEEEVKWQVQVTRT